MKFPNPESAGPAGLLALGRDLLPQTLEQAYSQGIFPWPEKGKPLLWFSPDPRGVLFFDQFKLPKSTRKTMRDNRFILTENKAFREVIENCSTRPRKLENQTWILPEMVEAYVELHRLGHAQSVEAWLGDKLVGGIYGVQFRGVFSGESMFYKESEASKVCLAHLVQILSRQGHQWIDIQMVTPLLAQLGAVTVPRKKYLHMLLERQQQYS